MKSRKNKSNILHKVMIMAAVSVLFLTAVFLVIYVNYNGQYEEQNPKEQNGEIVVDLNEVCRLLDEDSSDMAKQRLNGIMSDLQQTENSKIELDAGFIILYYIASILIILAIFLIIYILVLRPFGRLEDYAADVAAGNLDIDLKYNRVNLFGEFTWAFDHMRREIKKAKACEQEAIVNNKTVIATLSHDIKTPIASIRAYAEGLSENMDSTKERRDRYINVIIKKCDEVTKITNDMFIHSLHDLDKLVIKKEKVQMDRVISDTIEAMEGNKMDIIIKDIKQAVIPEGDEGRIAQIIENIINNARKYAKGTIYVDTDMTEEVYILSIKDSGKGIPSEDMPFIFEKFYRGENCGDEPGSGLGLFIVKYIMEQMDGSVELVNEEDGLLVKLFFPRRNEPSRHT